MSDFFVIRTARDGLRRWNPEDATPFARMNSDPEVMRDFPKLLSPGETDALLDRITAHFERYGYGPYAAEQLEDGRFIGFLGLQWATFAAGFTPALETGRGPARAFWKRGYATEAAREVLRFGFEELKQNDIVSFTSALNAPSIAVVNRIGLRFRDSFDHPNLPPVSSLRQHVPYGMSRREYTRRGS